jgi:4-hydroxy-tetrahydrodipicolinate reductase
MNIALVGYGKMGKEIEQIAINRGHRIVLIIDRNNEQDFNVENIKKADVVIEFSTPSSAYSNYKKCFEACVPVVSGTTGWLAKREEIEADCLAKDSGFFYASNFSLGVNIFFEMNKKLASLMNSFPQYDVDMEETHHIHKLDAPSGTAITLVKDVLENLDRKDSWQLAEADSDSVLKIEAIRENEVPGTHSIRYFSEVDEIKITHEAYGRKGFALGAVLAAEFMNGKKGLYSMKDLLNL